MTKTYRHRYQSGNSIALTVDLSTTPITITCDPAKVEEVDRVEYRQWLTTFVVGDLLKNLTPEQERLCCLRGVEVARKYGLI